MDDRSVAVLLIEDNPGDARLIAEILGEARQPHFVLHRAARLSKGLEWLAAHDIDVVLLDLNLPDSEGLDTLVAVRSAVPRVPVLVLTAMDEEAGPAALRAGAQDYLPKGKFDADLFVRSLRYAVERQLLLNQLEVRHQREQQARELQLLEAITGTTDSTVGARLFGARSLREASGEIFTKMARRYGDVLAAAVASGCDELPEEAKLDLDHIAGALAVLHASPRDAVELHAAAIAVKERLVSTDDIGEYLECGRQAVFELISQLAGHYRTYQIATREPLNSR